MLEKRIDGNHGNGAKGTLDANVDRIRFDFLTRHECLTCPVDIGRSLGGEVQKVTQRENTRCLLRKCVNPQKAKKLAEAPGLDREVQGRHQETHGRFYERDSLTQPNVHFSEK